MKKFTVLLATIILIACSSTHQPQMSLMLDPTATQHSIESANFFPLKPGVNEVVITQNSGIERKAMIELPLKIIESGHPIVFGLHGAGGKANGYNRRLKPFVNQHGLISVSPLGTKSKAGKTAWTFKKGASTHADDVGLIKAIIALLDKQGLVDHSRIYATGSSSGGLMAYRLAKETNLLAAIAPTKCGMAIAAHEPVNGTVPIAIMQVIGDEDKSFHGSNKRHPMYSASERINIWAKFNNCKSPKFIDYGSWSSTRYMCENNKDIELMIMKGVGHTLGKKWTNKTDEMLIEFLLKQRK
ncbi:alpha/beta hydrolase family esterase [Algibacillus agarilyticus]|uniref:alpha/beta hydrolase family esterase n=1 Tax=Algibacillus agarilyticus TaxID=2234133 RepID=UPI000DCFBFC5|nr:PHB depolymerase family esterase [Algibacillus agarilyticus]